MENLGIEGALRVKNLRVVVVAGLTDYKLWSKVAPLLAMDQVRSVTLVRRRPLKEDGVQNCCPPRWMAGVLPLADLYRVIALLWLCMGPRRPDLLVGIFMIPHGFYVGWIGRLFNIPVVQLIIGSDRKPALSRRWLRSHLIGASLVGVRGDITRREFEAIGIPPQKIFVPPNIFDVALWQPRDQAQIIYDMIYVGALVSRKRPQLLLRVVARLKVNYPDIKLAFVGEGPLEKSLREEVERLGLAENVVFLGQLSATDVAWHLARARLLTMAPYLEGLPMVLIEALSCGVPAVITDVNDIPMVATHGENAWIVSSPTVERYTEAVSRLLDDEDLYAQLRQGALESRERFRQEYSLEAATQVWQRAMDTIIWSD